MSWNPDTPSEQIPQDPGIPGPRPPELLPDEEADEAEVDPNVPEEDRGAEES